MLQRRGDCEVEENRSSSVDSGGWVQRSFPQPRFLRMVITIPATMTTISVIAIGTAVKRENEESTNGTSIVPKSGVSAAGVNMSAGSIAMTTNTISAAIFISGRGTS